MVYRFYHIPGATPRDIINKKYLDMPGYFGSRTLPAEARGPEITVDFVDVLTAGARSLGTTTHLSVCTSADWTHVWSTWYRVTSVIEIAPATATQGRTWRIKATLAALQTVVTNSLEVWTESGVTRRLIDSQHWQLNRAGLPDPHQTSESVISQFHRYRALSVQSDLSALSSMVAVVTAYTTIISTYQPNVLWQLGGVIGTDPQSYVICGEDGSLYNGSSGLSAIGLLLANESLRSKIYRIQLVPSVLIDSSAYGSQVLKFGDISVYGKLLKSAEKTSNILQPSISEFSGLAYRKAYGDPKFSFEYGGVVLGKFDVISNANANASVSTVLAVPGIVCSMGVTAYIVFRQNGVMLGLAALPVPEIIGSTDGVQKWYETVGRNLTASTWQSSAMTVGMSALGVAASAATGGVAPLLTTFAGAGMSIAGNVLTAERQREIGLQQAQQTVYTVGTGPSNFYAMTTAQNILRCYVEKINTTDRATAEAYFRRNGYSCAVTRDNLTTLDRQNFESFSGSGTFSVWGNIWPEVTVEFSDLHDRANAELGSGVTVWSTSAIGDYTVANDPIV